MRALDLARSLRLVLAAALAAGCASGTSASRGGTVPPVPPPPAAGPTHNAVVGANSDVATALYDIRYSQTLPSSSGFNYRDRDLSFYFRPTSAVLTIQIENLQDRPVWIDWDRSVFRDPVGRSGKVAHEGTTWGDRYGTQAQTQIFPLKTYQDYLFPMDYLLDPAGSPDQLHRPLIPLDSSAPQYSGTEFGVDLVLMIEQQPRNYSFRFKVASVIPRTR